MYNAGPFRADLFYIFRASKTVCRRQSAYFRSPFTLSAPSPFLNMSKEIRTGLLVVVSVLVFFIGFYFLKGAGLFSNQTRLITHYEQVQGLQPSAFVTIKGIRVGRVTNIQLNGEGGVQVELSIDNKYPVPRGTVAQMYSQDLVGIKAIRLDLGTAKETLKDGAILPGSIEPGKIDAVTEELKPLLQNVRQVALHLDSALISVNGILDDRMRMQLHNAVASLETTTQNFAAVSGNLKSKNAALGRTIDNAEKTTQMLADNRGNIDATLTNLKEASAKFKDAPIDETVRELQQTAGRINNLLRQIESGEGSLGKMVNDKALYDNLSNSAAEFSRLAEDLRKHPGRYINVNIFGRRARTVQE